jgi:hypothetical protein
MAETFIIDAYNLMRFFVPEERVAADLETSRQALERNLDAFRRTMGPGTRILLIYDGARSALIPARSGKGLEVRFSRPPQTADDLVLELCWKLEGDPGLHVVTSDFSDIVVKIRSLRLKHWTSAEFARFARKRLAKTRTRAENLDGGKPKTTSSLEAEKWVREFGFGDGDEGEVDGGGGIQKRPSGE